MRAAEVVGLERIRGRSQCTEGTRDCQTDTSVKSPDFPEFLPAFTSRDAHLEWIGFISTGGPLVDSSHGRTNSGDPKHRLQKIETCHGGWPAVSYGLPPSWHVTLPVFNGPSPPKLSGQEFESLFGVPDRRSATSGRPSLSSWKYPRLASGRYKRRLQGRSRPNSNHAHPQGQHPLQEFRCAAL